MARLIKLTFRHAGAGAVSVAGDFNGWDVSVSPMSYDPDLDQWSITLELEQGRYEYKFFVDGRDWWNDLNAPKVPNVWGSENSYVDVA
jgi:1,4-alpha-glucan branching enzyme